jgi:hypothetical protein
MCISRARRKLRQDILALKSIRCSEHRMRDCANSRCRWSIKQRFYSAKKKTKRSGLPGDVDSLFRLLRQPTATHQADEPLDALSQHFLAAEELPIDKSKPEVLKVGDAYLPSEKKLTLKELIARKRAA